MEVPARQRLFQLLLSAVQTLHCDAMACRAAHGRYDGLLCDGDDTPRQAPMLAPVVGITIDLAHCAVGDEGVPEVVGVMRSIHMAAVGTGTGQGAAGADDDVAAAAALFRCVDLRGNGLSDLGAERAISAIVAGVRVGLLDLRGNRVSQAGVASMVEALRGLPYVDHVIVGPDGKLEALGLPAHVAARIGYVCPLPRGNMPCGARRVRGASGVVFGRVLNRVCVRRDSTAAVARSGRRPPKTSRACTTSGSSPLSTSAVNSVALTTTSSCHRRATTTTPRSPCLAWCRAACCGTAPGPKATWAVRRWRPARRRREAPHRRQEQDSEVTDWTARQVGSTVPVAVGTRRPGRGRSPQRRRRSPSLAPVVACRVARAGCDGV